MLIVQEEKEKKGKEKRKRESECVCMWSKKIINLYLYPVARWSFFIYILLKKGRGTIVRRMIFIAHAIACFFQLFVVTSTSNDLIEESRAIGDAAYNANWQVLSHNDNKGVRNAILMIMKRAMRPCSISAGGFFPVSLETFMTVSIKCAIIQVNIYL